MSTGNLEDWIALNLLPGLGPVLLRRALQRFRDPAEIAYRVPIEVLDSLGRVGRSSLASIPEARQNLRQRAAAERARSDKLGLQLIVRDDPRYPAALALLPDAPILLYVSGDLPQAIVRVAVVGSRRPTVYGRRIATGLASGLAARGVEVVSGGARGIDTCAHRGALEKHGRTVAVLGSGFLHPYPPENNDLFQRIAASGSVLTEFALDQRPKPENFPRRNRLISGLAAAVVVVEAGTRSGSLGTAAQALEQGREVMAVPGPVSSEQSVGCHRLIQDGAKLVQNVEDVLGELSPMYRDALKPVTPVTPGGGRADALSGGTEDENAVGALLDEVEPLHLDQLAERAPFGIARLQAALFGLELRGAIEQHPGRYFTRRPTAAGSK